MSEEIRLRAVDESDLEVFLEQEHDPEAVRRSKFPPRERERFLNHWRTRVLGDPIVFVRAVLVDGELAGNIAAWWEGDKRYLGYWLGRSYWGRGIGTRALANFLELETARPIYADPVVENAGSIRILEKCGFSRIRTERHGENEHACSPSGSRRRRIRLSAHDDAGPTEAQGPSSREAHTVASRGTPEL